MSVWEFVAGFMWSWVPLVLAVWVVWWVIARGGGVLRRYWRD